MRIEVIQHKVLSGAWLLVGDDKCYLTREQLTELHSKTSGWCPWCKLTHQDMIKVVS